MTNEFEAATLEAGWESLKKAAWETARRQFETVLSRIDSPEAQDGLGLALWWLNEIEAAHEQRTQAYIGYKSQGNYRRAALLAAWLAREQVFLNGNASAMQGWFARAERALEEAGPCVEQGWYNVFRASMLATHEELERITLETIPTAQTYKDLALEIFALAFCGQARVALGRVSEGMGNLDEAMTAATGGELVDFATISETFCVMLSACELAGDLGRCEDWCHKAQAFAERHQCSFLGAYCRTTYGGLLAAKGRWDSAETELTRAIQTFETGHRALGIHAVLKLADLRVSQGRLEEAEVLLQGFEDQGEAVRPLARLYLARGETELAQALLEQALVPERELTLHHAPLLVLLCETKLVLNDPEAAQLSSASLDAIAKKSQSELLLAQADLVAGKVLARMGNSEAAAKYQSVISRLKAYDPSLLASRARLELARLLVGTDRAGAITWGRAALAAFERMGATQDTREAKQLLRELKADVRPGQRPQDLLTEREAEVMALLAQGLTNREIAEKLVISAKTVEHHVSQVLGKLGARSRTEVAAMAVRAQSTNKGRG